MIVIDFYSRRLLGPQEIERRAAWQPQNIIDEMIDEELGYGDEDESAYRYDRKRFAAEPDITRYASTMASRHFQQDTRRYEEEPYNRLQPVPQAEPIEDPSQQLREAARRLRQLAAELRATQRMLQPEVPPMIG
jgi:hypothetical protein